MIDDQIIGIKSTAIKFEKNIKFFVGTCYLLTFLLIIYVFKNYIGINLSSFFILMFTISLIYQIKIFSNDNPMTQSSTPNIPGERNSPIKITVTTGWTPIMPNNKTLKVKQAIRLTIKGR